MYDGRPPAGDVGVWFARGGRNWAAADQYRRQCSSDPNFDCRTDEHQTNSHQNRRDERI